MPFQVSRGQILITRKDIVSITWKFATNSQIRTATSLKGFQEDNFPAHPWMFVRLSQSEDMLSFAFSRNSVQRCDYVSEIGEAWVSGEWLPHHRHDHNCSVITLCGRVNIGFDNRRGAPRFQRMTYGCFERMNSNRSCAINSEEFIERVVLAINTKDIHGKLEASKSVRSLDAKQTALMFATIRSATHG